MDWINQIRTNRTHRNYVIVASASAVIAAADIEVTPFFFIILKENYG